MWIIFISAANIIKMFLSHKLLWKTFPLPSQSLLLAASSVVYHASNRVDEMTTLAIFTYSSSDTNHKYLNKSMYFLCSLLSFPFCCFWGCVVWLVGFFFFHCLWLWSGISTFQCWIPTLHVLFPWASVLALKGSRVLCFSVSCSQNVLCVLILVET